MEKKKQGGQLSQKIRYFFNLDFLHIPIMNNISLKKYCFVLSNTFYLLHFWFNIKRQGLRNQTFLFAFHFTHFVQLIRIKLNQQNKLNGSFHIVTPVVLSTYLIQKKTLSAHVCTFKIATNNCHNKQDKINVFFPSVL